MRLFELCAKNRDYRFSPYVWKVLMALQHKGIDFERVPCGFLEKDAFAPSGSKTVPVIEDDGNWVADSWKIACYLEDRYGDQPALFGGAMSRAQTRFIDRWADVTLIMGMFPMVAADICRKLDGETAEYFRRTREERLGSTLEEGEARRDELLPGFRQSLLPLRLMLKEQPFISGDAPAQADYCVFGPFQWARLCSDFEVLESDDPVWHWRERMLALFDGFASGAPRAAA